jgi:hypothetical protein
MEHLDHEALVRASYGVPGGNEAEHLAACPKCAAAAGGLTAYRAGRPSVDLPEAFWLRQRQTIIERLRVPQRQWVFLRRFALVTSMASLILAAVALVSSSGAPKPSFTREDVQLLQEINLTVSRIEPRALAPATLLLPREFKEVAR